MYELQNKKEEEEETKFYISENKKCIQANRT